MLVPELQKRGIYWEDYAVPGGTLRENMHSIPGQKTLPASHPGAKVRWNAEKEPKVNGAEVVVPVIEALKSEVAA